MASATAGIEWFFLKEEVIVTVTLQRGRTVYSGALTGISQHGAYVETLAEIPGDDLVILVVRVPGEGGVVVHLRCTVAPRTSMPEVEDADVYRLDFLHELRTPATLAATPFQVAEEPLGPVQDPAAPQETPLRPPPPPSTPPLPTTESRGRVVGTPPAKP